MNLKALVVDDDHNIRGVFTELLQLAKFDVIGTGSDGKEAAELYQKLHPDVVFIDALMPKYDGFYGVEKIKEYDPDAVIVMVTGSINVDERLEQCKATAVLPKPIDIDKIISVTSKFCVH
ncbi:MAG: response regulator [Thaumarchaeota archaeon]|nr:response regulator [Nitrososphaerota archaeon]